VIAEQFVKVPAGRFLMGARPGEGGQDDELPAHWVEVDAFEMAIYPVTQHGIGTHFGQLSPDPMLPAIGVSWDDAMAYCAARGGVRLPTEAEWEWAARGGLEGALYPWGDEIPSWLPNGGKGPLDGPWPVTLGEPNGFGLFGIGANIHEWCSDWHSASYYAESPVTNPTGPPAGVRRVSRGGAWRHAFTFSRCAQRSKLGPALRYTDYGFRVVRI
jgi:formylglycine-generating enzyme required for sulfatase activity